VIGEGSGFEHVARVRHFEALGDGSLNIVDAATSRCDRIDAELALGGGGTLVGELEGLAREHPYRERLRGQLMLALYRTGRQAEALEAYRDARFVLVEELGIEPSPDLRELHEAILSQDRSLLGPGAGVERARTERVRRGDGAPLCGEAPGAEEDGGEASPAAPLGETTSARRARKVVTALFCDVTGSTALGEQLDPEVWRELLNRYFAEIRAVIERHGGTVEKFIGDAVVAVFGIPRVHEDDAVPAVRAAAEMRERLPAVAEQVGVELRFRSGVNTGPVLMAEGESLAVGDAVNLAARLEQAAQPGEILIGEHKPGQAGGGLVTARPALPLPGASSSRAWNDACQPGLSAGIRSARSSCWRGCPGR
jgi:class 3 adenylate cyclase